MTKKEIKRIAEDWTVAIFEQLKYQNGGNLVNWSSFPNLVGSTAMESLYVYERGYNEKLPCQEKEALAHDYAVKKAEKLLKDYFKSSN